MHYVQKMNLEELEPLIDLINSAYRGVEGLGRWTTENHLVDGDRIDRHGLVAMIDDAETDFIVGYIDGKISACIAIKHCDGFVEFGTFAVDPELHGKGYGGQLLNYAESISTASESIFQVSVVSNNKDLIAFYQRRGYRETGKRDSYPTHLNVGTPKMVDIDLTILRKRLSA